VCVCVWGGGSQTWRLISYNQLNKKYLSLPSPIASEPFMILSLLQESANILRGNCII
jgi:hypothetical protein